MTSEHRELIELWKSASWQWMNTPLRSADRFSDAFKKLLPEDEPLVSLAGRDRRADEKYRNSESDHFSFFIARALEFAGRSGWLRAQARKLADLNGFCARGTWRRGGSLRAHRRETAVLSNVTYGSPWNRYATGTRFGLAVCGRHGAPLNHARYDEDRSVRCGVRILQPGAVSLPHEPLAVCAHVRQ